MGGGAMLLNETPTILSAFQESWILCKGIVSAMLLKGEAYCVFNVYHVIPCSTDGAVCNTPPTLYYLLANSERSEELVRRMSVR